MKYRESGALDGSMALIASIALAGLALLAATAQAADGSRLALPATEAGGGARAAAVAEAAAPASAPAPAPSEVYASKPVAPIEIRWEFSGEPRVGQPLTVSLTISAAIEVGRATLTVDVDDPLALIEPVMDTPLGNLVPGTPVAVDVTVLPLSDIVHYLRVAVAGESGGQPQMRSVSIAIRLDNRATSKDEPGVAGPDNAVHSLPAEETVL